MPVPLRGARGALLVLLALPLPLLAQTVTVRARENLRAAPNGEVVAVLDPGTPLRVVGRRDDWIEVDLEGWIWLRSLQRIDQDGFDLVVSVEEGENVRAEPSGAVLGRLRWGTLLDERERIPGWARARRRAWIWAASVAQGAAAAPAEAAPVAASAGPSAPSAPAPAPAAASARGVSGGAAILTGPDGDTLARSHPGAELQVLSREGNWARVRVEGWAWLPAAPATSDGAAVITVAPAELARDPERYRGRILSWELQFLSLERAERIRTEFFEGEPFLLTRHVDGGYVYVALPADRVAEGMGLNPLERIRVVGRVRSPASALTGSPILDLLELDRAPGGG